MTRRQRLAYRLTCALLVAASIVATVTVSGRPTRRALAPAARVITPDVRGLPAVGRMPLTALVIRRKHVAVTHTSGASPGTATTTTTSRAPAAVTPSRAARATGKTSTRSTSDCDLGPC